MKEPKTKKIDEPAVETPVVTSATIPVKLLYAVWLKEGERTEAGTVLELDAAFAKQLLADKKAERADPLPA